jgi:hypothetical protein
VLLVLRRAGTGLPSVGIGPSVLVAGVSGLGLLLVIIRWLSLPRYRGIGVGARYGIYLALIGGIVEVVAAVAQMRASGEEMPWAQPRGEAAQQESDAGASAVSEE